MYKGIAIAIRKGGVGKTTSVFNIASILAARGNKVLMIDLDAQANLSKLVKYASGLEYGDKVIYTVDDVLNDLDMELDINKAIYATDFENLHILPATKKLERTEKSLLSVTLNDTRVILLDHLMTIADEYDYVVIDTAPNAEGLCNLNGLCASDRIYIPMGISDFEMDALEDVLKVAKNLKRANKKLKVGGVFFCKFEKHLNNSKDSETQIERAYPELYMDTYIKKANVLVDMSYDGIPLIIRDPKMKQEVTQQYVKLVEKIIERA